MINLKPLNQFLQAEHFKMEGTYPKGHCKARRLARESRPEGCLLVLAQVQTQQAQIVLLAPVWKTRPWYPLLLSMAVGCPYLVLNQDRAPMIQTQLAVWNISGRDTETKSFRRRLPLSCSNHGGKRPISLTTHSSADGIAGVIEGKPIPFLVL